MNLIKKPMAQTNFRNAEIKHFNWLPTTSRVTCSIQSECFISASSENIPYFLRGSITVRLKTCLTALDLAKKVNLLRIKTNKAAESKPVKQEVSQPVILPNAKYVSVLWLSVPIQHYPKTIMK